jgi:hypothetical protein
MGSALRRSPGEDLDSSYQEEKEDSILSTAGFRPTVEGWWARGSVLFNKETALRIVQQELHKSGDDISL